jgi:hypothetical protein
VARTDILPCCRSKKYSERLAEFAGLYADFYQGRRNYSLKPEEQFDFFDFPNQKLSLLALSSCHGNDPMQRAGRMDPTALAEARRQLSASSRTGWLLAAAWHHNLTGGLRKTIFWTRVSYSF